MFPTLKLLKAVQCPDKDCRRACLFTHEPVPTAQRAENGESVAKRPRLQAPVSSTKPEVPPVGVQRPAGPPRLTHFPGTHSPVALRNEILKLLYNAFFECYALLPNRRDLAYDHAMEQERAVYRATKAHSYKAMASQAITKVKKRDKPMYASDEVVGINEDVESRTRAAQEAAKQEPDQTLLVTGASARPYTLAKAPAIAIKDYVLQVPPGQGGSEPDQTGKTRLCDRCKKSFVVKALSSEAEKMACHYHWGKLRNERGGGPTARRVFTCCGSTAPCSIGAHVFTDSDAATLHERAAFVPTSAPSESHVEVVALDCELVYTTAGLSLARVTAILPGSSKPILDEYVRPPGSVLDCNTRFSGIKSGTELEAKAVLDLAGVQRALSAFIGSNTILVGHGLENDLKALRLVHPLASIIDTAILYPHPAGFPIRHSLRNLVKSYLGTFIQDEGTHDSSIDARSALELVALKIAAKGGEPRKLA